MSERPRRFIIEGVTWGGERRVVHRKVYPARRKVLREWAARTHAILYTDGTMLYLNVRNCKPRERVEEIDGYSKLIEECAAQNVTSVRALSG